MASVQVAGAIALEATLSFLGVGLPLTEPSLGSLISNGFKYIHSDRHWLSIYPGVALMIAVVAINLVGDRVRHLPRSEGPPMSAPALDVRGLVTRFDTRAGPLTAVNGVSFSVERGRILGLVGESGSGKSVTGFSILGLIDEPGEVAAGEVRVEGVDMRALSLAEQRRMRGNRVAMVFQDPMMTLNPVLTVGDQMRMAVRAHAKVSKAEASERARRALEAVGIPSPAERLRAYPHQLSGGMRQRVAIAIALLHQPAVIIADEPTTALDVSIQGQILAEIRRLADDTGTAVVWITHDLAVVSSLADDLCVMYAGRIVERGPADAVIARPRHPYTRGFSIRTRPARTRQPAPPDPGLDALARPSSRRLPVPAPLRASHRALQRGAAAGHARCAGRPLPSSAGSCRMSEVLLSLEGVSKRFAAPFGPRRAPCRHLPGRRQAGRRPGGQ